MPDHHPLILFQNCMKLNLQSQLRAEIMRNEELCKNHHDTSLWQKHNNHGSPTSYTNLIPEE